MNEMYRRPMNPDRFRALTDSYGGDMARWPIAERGAARRFAVLNPFSSWRTLRRARGLDRILARSRESKVSRQLYERISRNVLAATERAAPEQWVRGALLGAGLAAACAAGIVTGIVFTPQIASTPHVVIGADPVEDATAALREPTDLGEA